MVAVIQFLLLWTGFLCCSASAHAGDEINIQLIQGNQVLLQDHHDSILKMIGNKSFNEKQLDSLFDYLDDVSTIQSDIRVVWEAFYLRSEMKDQSDRMRMDLYLKNKKWSMKNDCTGKIEKLSRALPRISSPMIFLEINSLKSDLRKVCDDIENQFKLDLKW